MFRFEKYSQPPQLTWLALRQKYPKMAPLINKELLSAYLHVLKFTRMHLNVLNYISMDLNMLHECLEYQSTIDWWSGVLYDLLVSKYCSLVCIHISDLCRLKPLLCNVYSQLCQSRTPEFLRTTFSVKWYCILCQWVTFSAIAIYTRPFVTTGVANWIDRLLVIPSLSLDTTWIFYFMILNDPIVLISIFLYRVEVFLSPAIKMSGAWSMKTCFRIVKVGKKQIFLSKYRLYLVSCFGEFCETLFCIGATWCSILCC